MKNKRFSSPINIYYNLPSSQEGHKTHINSIFIINIHLLYLLFLYIYKNEYTVYFLIY